MEFKGKLVARPRRCRKWFKWRRREGRDPHLSDGEGDEWDNDGEGEFSKDGDFVLPTESGSCIQNNEFRVFVGTWNVAGRSPLGSLDVDLDDWLNLKDSADIYVLGFQEIVPLKAKNVVGAEDEVPAHKWNTLIGRTLNKKCGCPWLTPLVHRSSSNDDYWYEGSSYNFENAKPVVIDQPSEPRSFSNEYKLMASKKMVGAFISVWMKKELLKKYCVSNVKLCSVACGIMGYLGNKGAVSVSMSIEGTSFCFIAAHLASGEKTGDELRRNHQVSEIFRRTSFPRARENDDNPHPRTILGHDRIFWFGDLNYRLCLEDSLARKLVQDKDWRALQEFDQLRKERESGGVFQGWREGSIEFAPTYKYSSPNRNRYSGGFPSRSGEKIRTPAWCDRILWCGKGVKQLSYFRSESKFSDHRPVSALFSTHIEVIKSADPTANIISLPPTIPPLHHQTISGISQEAEGKTTLLKLLVQDIEASAPRATTSLGSWLSSEQDS
ncbi:hypothetical protein Syun_023928 [Stephania yunnanensis]|uniref:Inositol polyphosphate-related phosphatase domain-containing protein n=1 Tax=Stephania yunnanensis TaxID=152371 RepID=A0AAP0FDT0_9MAGN